MSATSQAEDARRIAYMIESAKLVIASCGVLLPVLNDRELQAAFQAWQQRRLQPDELPFLSFARTNGTVYTMNLDAMIAELSNNPNFNMIVLINVFTVVIPWIGHELSEKRYFTRSPELEFFRHLRNAVSHGNAFHFTGKEPSRQASFRSFEVTRTLQGRRALFAFIPPGDVLDLFDELEMQLRQIQ